MTWQPELDELRERERQVRLLGGLDKIERQHKGGRLTVRERIDGLVDAASFHEIGAIAGKAEYDSSGDLKELVPSNCVMGRATIDGRPVVVVGDDFTVRGGSADATIREKPILAEQMAHDLKLPIFRIIEGSGGGGSVKTIETTGRANLPHRVGSGATYYFTTANLGVVPVVALGLGSVAGLGAARMVSSHYSVMTKDTSAVFVAGPPVVNALGNAHQQGRPRRLGNPDPLRRGRRCGRYRGGGVRRRRGASSPTCRSRSTRCAPRLPSDDDPARRDEFLFDVIPRNTRRVYKMRPIVEAVVDKGSFFEMGRMFGRGIITGLARLDGLPVAVMASDPFFYGGAWTADACDKIIRFVDLAETFHLPVVYLCDCPGFHIGLEAEKAATIRKGVRAMAAVNQTTRAVVHVSGAQRVRRRRRGQPAGLPVRAALCLAVGALGLAAAGRRDRGRLPRRHRRRARSAPPSAPRSRSGCNKLRSPFRTAETFWVEEIIDPRDTRRLACDFARLAEKLRTPGEAKFQMRP